MRKLSVSSRADPGEDRDGHLDRHEWWLPDLARELEMSANKLRDWALRGGWVRPAGPAARPLGRLGRWSGTAAVAEAPGHVETRPGRGRSPVSRGSRPLKILDPIDPYSGRRRGDRVSVTKEALCRADPDVRRKRIRLVTS